MKRTPLKRKTPLQKQARNVMGTKLLHRKLWKLFSEYIRRSEEGQCYTCLVKKHWKEMQAGHYKHNVLDFDEMNVHCQCVRCNKYLHGNGGEYAFRLARHYGLEELNDLHIRAYRALAGERHEPSWYQEKITFYTRKLQELTEQGL